MKNAANRKEYRKVSQWIKQLAKVGGEGKAKETVRLLRESYPQRRAMLEELDAIKLDR